MLVSGLHDVYVRVYEPVLSEPVSLLRSHDVLLLFIVQPDGQEYVVPVDPVGQQQAPSNKDTEQLSRDRHDTIACADEDMTIANPKPTFRFGTKWESKNAEIWD